MRGEATDRSEEGREERGTDVANRRPRAQPPLSPAAIDIDAEFRIITGDPDADEHHDDDGGPAAIVRLLAPTEKDEWDEDLLRTFEDAERALGVVDGEPFTTEGDPEIPIAEFQALNLTSSATVLR